MDGKRYALALSILLAASFVANLGFSAFGPVLPYLILALKGVLEELPELVAGTVEAVFSGNLALIYHLAVHPDYQRRGIGRALVEEILRRLGARGATYALVFNHSSHRDALGFYRRLGFRSIGTFRGLYIRTARARK